MPKQLKGNGREGARNGRPTDEERLGLLDRAAQAVHEFLGGTGPAPRFGIGEGAAKQLFFPGGGTTAGITFAGEAVKSTQKKRKNR